MRRNRSPVKRGKTPKGRTLRDTPDYRALEVWIAKRRLRLTKLQLVATAAQIGAVVFLALAILRSWK